MPKGYHGPRWTRAQLRLLGKEPDDLVAAKVSRSPNAVRVMRGRLGIPNPAACGWTEREDGLVRALAPTEAARKTGRTLSAIYRRRHQLRLPDGHTRNGPGRGRG